MRVDFSVRLPVEVTSVPFARRMCRFALEHLGVDPAVILDVTLALTEACANVVEHTAGADDFEVTVAIDDDTCRIFIRDRGAGFPDPVPPDDGAASVLEDGRGLFLMRALVDDLQFRTTPGDGHEVVLEKRLVAAPTSLV